MKKFMLWFFAILALYLLLQAIYSGYYLRKAIILTRKEYRQDGDYGKKSSPILKVFMDGDSIASGVGASSFETSTPGLLVNFLEKNHRLIFINRAKSGKKMAALLTGSAPLKRQDFIVLIVSSNDLFHFTPLAHFQESTKKVFEKYSKQTKKLIILGPGRVSTAPALPLPLRLIYQFLESKYVSIIAKEAGKYSNVVYVKPGTPGKGTFASDKFHPNDEGHKVWFEAIKKVL